MSKRKFKRIECCCNQCLAGNHPASIVLDFVLDFVEHYEDEDEIEDESEVIQWHHPI